MTQKRITIYDIAREAGVSASTVSRILANSAGVKPEKRQRVMALVEKYNFTPNAMAKGLSKSRSRFIGMLCPDVRNPFYSSVFAQCEQAAYQAGYTLLLNNTFGEPEKEITYMQRMVEQRVDSLIICGGVVDWNPLPEAFEQALRQCIRQVPVVVAGKPVGVDCYQVVLDHADGMRQAVRCLSDTGHRRIAFLHGPMNIVQTQIKLDAYREMLFAQGIPFRPEYLAGEGSFDEKSGLRGMQRLLALAEPPTAVIAANDLMGVGALQAIQRSGLRVPGDISLIGCDDVFLTELTQPNLSSLRVDYERYGKMLIDTALLAIDQPEQPEMFAFPMQLRLRGSCRAIESVPAD